MVAFVASEAEHALLEDRVGAVPQRQREAKVLLVVGDAGDTVFTPTVSPRARLIVAEALPRGAARAVVLAHCAPLALAHIWPEAAPPHLVLASFGQAFVFFSRSGWIGQFLLLSLRFRPAPRDALRSRPEPSPRKREVRGAGSRTRLSNCQRSELAALRHRRTAGPSQNQVRRHDPKCGAVQGGHIKACLILCHSNGLLVSVTNLVDRSAS